MIYLRSAHLFMICCCIFHTVSVKAKSNNSTNSVISKNNPNEKYKNHNMDGWTPIKPTLEYLKLNQQRKNCVSVGNFNADCKQEEIEPTKTAKYKSIVDYFQRDYHSPYGNYVADIIPKLPYHYTNPSLPRYRQNNRRQFGGFPSDIKRNLELPRFIDEYATKRFGSRSFRDSVAKYRKRQSYPMYEPIPGQILYPPIVPQFKSNPLNKLLRTNSRNHDDIAYSRDNASIKTFQSTIFPFFEHEHITKKSSANKERYRSTFDTTSPVISMVIEPTTIRYSSTTSSIKPSTKPSIQYVYSVAANQSKKTNLLYDFEKELPRKAVIESPPKKSIGDDQMSIAGDVMISTKLSNRFLEYTTSGYSVYVTIPPFTNRPEKRDTTESMYDNTNEIPKIENRIKVIPLLRPKGEHFDSNEDLSDLKSSSPSNPTDRTYVANHGGFKNLLHKTTKKTTLKPQIYTLSSLLLDMDTDNQSASHQLSKPGQYVDHLSSAIINDYVGKTTQRTEQQPSAEAVQSSITIKHQPPLPNKSNNENTTNSRWTTMMLPQQPHELYTINNNDGINDRDQRKIKDINLDIVIPTDGTATTSTSQHRNHPIYENKNYSGINDGDEWNDGNVDDGNSRSFNGYGRVNVEPNVDWIMVGKSEMDGSKDIDRQKHSRSERLTSASYKDFIIPMTMKRMPKVNNSNMVLGTNILVQ